MDDQHNLDADRFYHRERLHPRRPHVPPLGCLSTAILQPFIDLPLPFFNLPLPFHCLSLTFPRFFHRLSLTCNCLSIDLSTAFPPPVGAKAPPSQPDQPESAGLNVHPIEGSAGSVLLWHRLAGGDAVSLCCE